MQNNNKAEQLFKRDACLATGVLFRYHKRQLDKETILKVEHHLTYCSLCNDALDGMALIDTEQVFKDIGTNNRYKKIAANNGFNYRWILVIVVGVAIIYLYKSKESNPDNNAQAPIAEVKNRISLAAKVDSHSTPATESFNSISNPVKQLALSQKKEAKANPIQDTRIVAANVLIKNDTADYLPQSHHNNEHSSAAPSLSGAFPIIYIYDLKVIDYTSFYDQQSGLTMWKQNSLEAKYESEEDRKRVLELLSKDSLFYKEALNNALMAFSKKNYNEAKSIFTLIQRKYPDDLNAFFYKGVCDYHLQNYNSALREFENVLNHRKSGFEEETLWYKALSLRESGNLKAYEMLLTKIAEQNGFYSKKAQQLLKETNH